MPRKRMSDEERKAKRRASSKRYREREKKNEVYCGACKKYLKKGSVKAHHKTKTHKLKESG